MSGVSLCDSPESLRLDHERPPTLCFNLFYFIMGFKRPESMFLMVMTCPRYEHPDLPVLHIS